MSLDLTTETSSVPKIWYNQTEITLVQPFVMAMAVKNDIHILNINDGNSKISVCKGM